jgi:hypothetical protein
MFGEKLKLITLQCCVCHKMTVLRVDPEDLERHKRGVVVQRAFINRDGKPYLTASEQELFISQCCRECWALLCPSDPLAYN